MQNTSKIMNRSFQYLRFDENMIPQQVDNISLILK